MSTSVQFVVVRSEFCRKAKFTEGTIQESAISPPEGAMFNCEAGEDCEV